MIPNVTSSNLDNITISENIGNKNITIHQAYVNESVQEFSTDIGNQTIFVDTPNDSIFNMSSANILVDNIIANNYTNVINSKYGSYGTSAPDWSYASGKSLFSSFSIPISCNISTIFVAGYVITGLIHTFYIYNATWNTTNLCHYPDQLYKTLPQTFTKTGNGYTFFNISDQGTFLDTSKTTNNTWFLTIYTNTNYFPWGFDTTTHTHETYQYDPTTFQYLPRNYDLNLNISFCVRALPTKPSDIRLGFNSTLFIDSSIDYSGVGTLNNSIPLINRISYNFTCLWPNASWDVIKIWVNFTGIISGITNFTMDSNQDIFWNITTSISVFNTNFNNYSIQFDIPKNWNFSEIYYNSIIQSSSNINEYELLDKKNVLIPSSIASNGIWCLISNSSNIINELYTKIQNVDRNWARISENISVSCDIRYEIFGEVNLTLFNSSLSSVYTISKTIAGSSFELDDFNISKYISTYEDMIVQVFWYNSTDAFVIKENVSIVAPTSITFTTYSDYCEILSEISGQFNITWGWKDTYTNNDLFGTSVDATCNLIAPNPLNNINGIEASYNSTGSFNVTLNLSLEQGDYILSIAMNSERTDNATFQFHFSIVTNTLITPKASLTNLTVVRGNNATYGLIYETLTSSPTLVGATIQNSSIHILSSGLFWSIEDLNNGEYQISLNTSNTACGIHWCFFNISLTEYRSWDFNFSLNIQKSPSLLTIKMYNSTLIRKDRNSLNITVEFFDLTQNNAIVGASESGFHLLTNDNTEWTISPVDVSEIGNGQYKLEVSLLGVNNGNYTFKVSVQDMINYQQIISAPFNFTLYGNQTQVQLESLKDQRSINVLPTAGIYDFYANNTFTLICYYKDIDFGNEIITRDSSTKVGIKIDSKYTQILTGISFELTGNTYSIPISLLNVETGLHTLEVLISQQNYENFTGLKISINIKPKISINISLVQIDSQIILGGAFNVQFKVEYFDSETNQWKPLQNALITIRAQPANGFTTTNGETDAEGLVKFTLSIPTGFDISQKLSLIIEYSGDYHLSDFTFISPEFSVQQGFTMYIIYGLVLLAIMTVLIPIIQKKVIQPRRQRYMDMVMSSATIFDDAINLKHILIIYKSSGTCIFFKSFGEETINPDLISGFISAVGSFGREIKAQKSLNEMSYGDNVLLFSDGQHIRVTLVLGKNASPYMKKNLAEFVGRFEGEYQKKLQDWHGSLNAFKDSGRLIDEILKTSVILPHQISDDKTIIRKITNSLSKQLLSIAQSLTTQDRSFIFLAQLMGAGVEQTKKDPAELIVALNQLLDLKILTPIQIESLSQAQPISEQEMAALQQRVSSLPDKNDSEKAELLKSLAEMNAVEREAALSSLQQSTKITTSFSGTTIETQKFPDVAAVKAELKKMEKLAKKEISDKHPDEAVKQYEIAEVLAYQWNLIFDGKRFGNLVLSTTVDKFRYIIKNTKKNAPAMEKKKEYAKAAKEYELALDACDQLFKLGFLDTELDSREFAKKIKECQKLGGSAKESKEYITKDNLLNARKIITKELKNAQKTKDFFLQNEIQTKLCVIANLLFQFGMVAESDNIKKSKAGLDDIKKQFEKIDAKIQDEMKKQMEEWNNKKPQLLDFAKDAESKQDFANALAAYQQVMTIYYKMGDIENATALLSKFKVILQNVPDLHKMIQDFEAESKKLIAANDAQNAEIQAQYAKALKEIIFLL